LTLVSLTDGEVIKDFGEVHDSGISGIMVTADQKFFFASSANGELKQWNYGDKTLVRDLGEVIDFISSLCL
jgi:hypothetical protein